LKLRSLKSRGQEDDDDGWQNSGGRCPRIALFHFGQGFLQAIGPSRSSALPLREIGGSSGM
jgi:hypothetical protein